jgi:hypothetical protein
VLWSSKTECVCEGPLENPFAKISSRVEVLGACSETIYGYNLES